MHAWYIHIKQVIDVQLFTIMVLMALVTTFTTSPVVALLYPPHRRRKFGARPGIVGAPVGAEAEQRAIEEEGEGKAAIPTLPVPSGLGLPAMGPEAAVEEEGKTHPCIGVLRLMLVPQRMSDVPGLMLLMELMGPEYVSAVRFVESEEIPLSMIMSPGTLRTGARVVYICKH